MLYITLKIYIILYFKTILISYSPGVYANWLRSRESCCGECYLDLRKSFPCNSQCRHVLYKAGHYTECSYGCVACTKYWYTYGRRDIINCGRRDLQG